MEMNKGILTIDFKDLNIMQLAIKTGAGLEAGAKTLFLINSQNPSYVSSIQLVADAQNQNFAEAALKAIKDYVNSLQIH